MVERIEDIEDRDARDEDERLARGMAAGDPVALAAAYRRHRDAVYTVACRLVGEAAAADLTHDAFLRAAERAGGFRGEGTLGRWIRRIAVNLCLRHLRREGRMVDAEPPERFSPAPARPSPIEAIALDRAIARLPVSLRTVLVLHAVEGFTHAEVADLLDISEVASRTRLHRARTALAAALEDGGEAG